MIHLFGCIILTALVVNGISIASGENMLLQPLKVWLHRRIGHMKIYKPLIGCVRCMPSIYGTLICLAFLPATWHLLYAIPVVILSASTLATIIDSHII